jgi:ParB-like chromosome segregation protein Spo0J
MKKTLITCALIAIISLHSKGQDIPPKEFWPKKVKILEDMTFTIAVASGKVGRKLPASTEVEVVSFQVPDIKLKQGNAVATVGFEKTNFLSLANEAYEQDVKKKTEEAEAIATKKAERDAALAKSTPLTDADMENAYYTARKFIQNALKAPSTAKFSNPLTDKETTGYTLDGTGRIKCRGVVEASNSFGATLRQGWSAYVQQENAQQWRIVYAVLGDQTLIDTRKQNPTKQEIGLSSFIGMTIQDLKKEFGEPVEIKEGNNPSDGKYKIYSFSKEKGKETYFTIWDSDGKVESGMYQGMYLPTN